MGKQSNRKKEAQKREKGKLETAEMALPEPPSQGRIPIWAWHLLALVFFVWVFGITTNFSLNDPDIWWHLKTGEFIAHSHQIPSTDPFNYTSPHPLSPEQEWGLRANWLSDLIFYDASALGGLMGVGFLRGILIVLPMFIIYLWLTERKVRPWVALSVTALASLMLATQLFYAFERPQGISFLFSLLAILILEELKKGKKAYIAALAILMILWANIHGGFIVGNVIIMLYIAGEAVTWVYGKIRKTGHLFNPYFYAGTVGGVLASGINPNGYHLFYNYLIGLATMFLGNLKRAITHQTGGWVAEVVLEYKPLIYFYKDLYYHWIMYYWIFLGILFVLLTVKYIVKKKVDMTELFTVLFTSFFANYYARGIMFSLIIASFYFGKSVYELRDIKGKGKISPQAARAIPLSFAVVCLLLSLSFVKYISSPYGWALKPKVTKEWVTPWYPMGAVQFIKQEKIAPPMYNFYTWGGFLIWSMYPDYQVFIDGRALNDKINRDADAILKSYPDWQQLMNQYNFNFLVIPVIFRESGHIIPMAISLVNDNDWKLVYLANNSAVFVRNIPKNREIIDRYQIDKRNIYKEIVNIEDVLLYSAPGNPIYNMSKADALYALGYKNQARTIYQSLPNGMAVFQEKYGQ